MRCFIVDDEIPAREELKYLLSNLKDIEIVGEAGDGESALELITRLNPEIVFLDIKMRGMSGFDLAHILLQLNKRPLIVFITAYDQYAIQAFEINAVDYLLKPVSTGRLEKTIERLSALHAQKTSEVEMNMVQLLKYISPKSGQKICVYNNGKHIPLGPEDIIFAKVEGRSTIIKSRKGEFLSSMSLGELEEKLKGNDFFRCHRSYLININEIQEIDNGFNGTYEIILKGYNKEKIPVSRSNAHTFRNLMNM